MFWRKNRNEKNNVDKELVLHVSSLELEITNYRDKVQNLERLSKQRLEDVKQLQKTITMLERLEDVKQLQKTITMLERLKDEKNDELAAKDIELTVKSREIKELKIEARDEREYKEGVILGLKNEIIELKKRLKRYVEEKHEPLDHYEYALTNYKEISIPIKAPRTNGYDRYAIEKLLPQEVHNRKSCETWKKIQEDFGYRCAITGVKHYDFEHSIPIHTGHGGAYEGNIIPMHWNLNSAKGNKNPFHWFRLLQQGRRHSSSLSLKRWDALIGYLAEKHNISVEDYFEFVNWCFANPRSKEQLQMVNTPSIELWKHSKTIIT